MLRLVGKVLLIDSKWDLTVNLERCIISYDWNRKELPLFRIIYGYGSFVLSGVSLKFINHETFTDCPVVRLTPPPPPSHFESRDQCKVSYY